jgi:CheY-like chemotaxis protein
MNATTTQRQVFWKPYLRPAPAAAEAALRVLSVGELDAATLALVIGSDPGLTSAVVRASEPSAMDTSIASRITGLTPSRLHSALFPALVDAFAASAVPFSDADASSWRFALTTAIAAESIARESSIACPDAAYLAGLLHNCAGASQDERLDGQRPENFRAIGRRYRYPAWLLDCLENQGTFDGHVDTNGTSDMDRVLVLAKAMAADLVGARPSPSAQLANAARDMRFDAGPIDAAHKHATQSLERRLSLFAFSPASASEMHASLLRFSNHLLLYWRVDETSATMLRKRVDHMGALLRFENATARDAPPDEILLTCADGLRASLSIDAGLIVAWPDPAAPVAGVRWNGATGPLEPFQMDSDGVPSERAIRRFIADDVWPLAANETVAPSVLPIHTPTHRHVGYIVLATSTSRPEGWLEQAREWTVALGRAMERVYEIERDDTYRETLRRTVRESRIQSDTPLGEPADLILRQRNLSRAAMAALHAPLSTITTQAHQLISQTAERETQGLVEELAKQARNAARVMADLRVIAGTGASPNEFILINAPLRQFLNAARPRLERRSIQLTEHYADGLPRIRADARKLHHLFTNLFAFIEHRLVRTGRTISVSSGPSGDRGSVCLTIDVAGLAITKEQTENLFAPFTDHERASNEFALALAACGAIVDEIGGSIGVAATNDGAVFSFAFDAVHAVLAVEPAPAPETPPAIAFETATPVRGKQGPGHEARVLIVDDDEVMRDLMRQALMRRNYRVEIAKDGDEALHILDATQVDVLLLDLLMPDHDGFAVLRELKQRDAAPPAIVMTGSRSADVRDEAMELGACSFLQKPFELGQLLAEVESILVHQRA